MMNRARHVLSLKVIHFVQCEALSQCNITIKCRAVVSVHHYQYRLYQVCRICILYATAYVAYTMTYHVTYHNTLSYSHSQDSPKHVSFSIFFSFIHCHMNQPHLNAQTSQLSTKQLRYRAKDALIHRFTGEEFKVCCLHLKMSGWSGRTNSVPNVSTLARCRLYNMTQHHLQRGHTTVTQYNCPGINCNKATSVQTNPAKWQATHNKQYNLLKNCKDYYQKISYQ